jgi:hypothetical protein
MIDSFAKALRRYFKPWLVDLFLDSCRAADFVKSDYPGEPKFVVRGSFKNRTDLKGHLGNRSGNPFTSEVAKQWGTYYALFGLWKRGDIGGTIEEIKLVLTGKHPAVRILNAGDNLIIVNLMGQEESKGKISDFIKIAVVEDAESFLGLVPISKQNVTSWLPSAESAVKNAIHKDKSAGSIHAPYWAHGWLSRWDYFKRNPAADHALQITDQVFKKHHGISITELAKRHFKDPNAEFGNLTDVERQFLFNPDYIHYRINLEDVRPELYERTYSTYTFQDFKNLRLAMIA